MAYRIGPTPQLSQPRSNSAEDVRGLALQAFKDSIDLRSRLIGTFPKDGSEAMEAPLPLQLVATGSLPAAADWEGALIYDTTTNTVKYSNGTSWVELPAPTVAFQVTKGSTDQTGVTGDLSQVTVTWDDTTGYDIGGFFSGNIWTPPAGLIALQASVLMSGDLDNGSLAHLIIRKNGNNFGQNRAVADVDGVDVMIQTYVEDVCDGNDEYDVQVAILTSSGTATIAGAGDVTYFNGHWIGAA